MTQQPYIVIEGVIGVGKTTLARYLKDDLRAAALLEIFEENPFLKDFYADRARYAFQTETFFLLSRYRQQHQIITETLRHQPLVSDYLFSKNWIFAQLNLIDDEWAVFESLYQALAERLPKPQLIVYLRASVDTLLERIAIRDRAYERDMQRDYIASLHRAYDTFFNSYRDATVITINTDEVNIVHSTDDRQAIIGQIKQTVFQGVQQPVLVEADTPSSPLDPQFLQQGRRRLPDFQQFHAALDTAKGFTPDLFLNYILLMEEIGELAAEFTKVWGIQQRQLAQQVDPEVALKQAVAERHSELKSELADCLAYLFKLANYAHIDLEEAYVEKMLKNIKRSWPNRVGLAHINDEW